MAVDWFIGTTTLTYMVRFLLAVTYWNGKLPLTLETYINDSLGIQNN